MATYSFLQQPYQYNPVNAPIWAVAYSTDNQVQYFNYLFNLYQVDKLTSTPSLLGVYNIPPRPTGEGVFDTHKILKSYVNSGYSFTMSYIMASTSSVLPITDSSALLEFYYQYGYQEYIGLTFSQTYNSGGFVGITGFGFTTSNFFVNNDVITLQMSGQSVNQQYNGQTTITGLTGFSITTSTPFVSAENISGGLGNIFLLSRFLGYSPNYYAVNGTRQYYDPNNSNANNPAGLFDLYTNNNLYVYQSATAIQNNFLTTYNLPDQQNYKSIFTGQYETAHCLIQGPLVYNLVVNTYDVNLNPLNTYNLATHSISQNYILYSVGVGTSNLQGLDGINLPATGYYNVSLKVAGTASNIMIKRMQIIQNCSPYTNVRIMFLNRLGGYDYYNFNYDSKIVTNINRTTYNKTLAYNYQIGDRGRTVLTIDAEDQVTVNTDFISEYDYAWLKELITSPEVFVIDEVRMLKLPIIITDTAWEQKTRLREKVFNLVMTYQYDFNIDLQTF